MKNPLIDSIRILIADPDPSTREQLAVTIREAKIVGDTSETHSIGEVFRLLDTESFDLVILGQGIERDEQIKVVQSIKSDPGKSKDSGEDGKPPCSVLPVFEAKEEKDIVAYITAGAPAILVPPITEEKLLSGVRNCLQAAYKRQQQEGGPPSSEGASLPWVLDNFATSLELIAKELEAAEDRGTKIDASPKAIKEAILSTIAISGGEVDRAALKKVAALLVRNSS